MSSSLFQVCRMLTAGKTHFLTEWESGNDCIRLTASFVGERVEIEIFDDNHIEIARFRGDESIEEGEIELLRELIRREREDC